MKKETLAESIAKYLAKGGKIVICPTKPMKEGLSMKLKYGRGSISYSGAKHVYLGNPSGKRG